MSSGNIPTSKWPLLVNGGCTSCWAKMETVETKLLKYCRLLSRSNKSGFLSASTQNRRSAKTKIDNTRNTHTRGEKMSTRPPVFNRLGGTFVTTASVKSYGLKESRAPSSRGALTVKMYARACDGERERTRQVCERQDVWRATEVGSGFRYRCLS